MCPNEGAGCLQWRLGELKGCDLGRPDAFGCCAVHYNTCNELSGLARLELVVWGFDSATAPLPSAWGTSPRAAVPQPLGALHHITPEATLPRPRGAGREPPKPLGLPHPKRKESHCSAAAARAACMGIDVGGGTRESRQSRLPGPRRFYSARSYDAHGPKVCRPPLAAGRRAERCRRRPKPPPDQAAHHPNKRLFTPQAR